MKRKIAILLAAVMTTAMLPLDAMAATSNRISRTSLTAKDGDPIGSIWADENETEVVTSGSAYTPAEILITPLSDSGVDKGTVISISLENAEFDTEKWDMPEYVSKNNKSFDELMDQLEDQGMTLAQVLQGALNNLTNELPYKITSVTKREILVELFPVDKQWCDKTGPAIATSVNKLVYSIPVHALADGSGDVKVSIDGQESLVSSGTYYVAKAVDDDGSTTTTVDELTEFNDAKEMGELTIKENIKGTFEAGKVLTVRTSGGFKFAADTYKNLKVKMIGQGNPIDLDWKIDDEDEKILITMPAASNKDFQDKLSSAARIVISGYKIVADDEDDDWGDVSLTVSGAGVTKETVKIGTRSDYGFKLTALDSPVTILAGRAYTENTKELEKDDFEVATVKFEESIANSWLTERKMKFTVPEGVKIVDYKFSKVKNVSKNDLETLTEITNDGTTLTVNKKDRAKNDIDDCAEFELDLYVSCDADFAGDITVGVSAAGVEGDLDDVVVANVVTPIKIESTTTKANLGYQAVDTADITITEVEAGALLDDCEVVVAIDSLYGSKELGFADEDIDYEIEGELEIKSFDVSDGEITFKIDKDSYNEPSSITIKNVKVGSTRSVPYGNYDIKVMGDAVINNYKKDLKDVYPKKGYDESGVEELALFDDNDGYSFSDYLQIVTETGTLDKVVKVTIGESAISMDGESVAMDVAPYIQASSSSTMVPLRFVSLAIGVDASKVAEADESSKVMWDANTKTATILYAAGNGQKIIQFTAGSNIMVIDGTAVPMENGVVAEITNNRMFVPFRALGQALGVPVAWDAETRTAIYNQK